MESPGAISRRRFLGLGITAATMGLLTREVALGQDVPGRDAIVVATEGSPGELVAGAVHALGGMGEFVKPGDNVLVKPNASFHLSADSGANTHPDVAAAVVSLCLQSGAKRVVLADHTIDSAFTVRANGIQAAAEGCGGEFVALRPGSGFEEVEIEKGYRLRSVKVTKLCSESNVLINLPVLKHHTATGACVGLKNLMGLVEDRNTFHNEGLYECIADLSLAIRPDLTIVDATRVITENGPRGPSPDGPLQVGRVVAGVDPVAVDVASLNLLSSLGYSDFGLDTKNRYVEYAEDHGVGDGNPGSVLSNTFTWDAPAGDWSCLDRPPPISLPNWAPYGALSAASVGLGVLAMIYDRRRIRNA